MADEGFGQFVDQVTLAGPSWQNPVEHRMRRREPLQRVRDGEQDIVGPTAIDCGEEALEVEVGDGLGKRLGGTGTRHGLRGPVDADTEPAAGEPVGVRADVAAGLSVGGWRSCANESAGHWQGGCGQHCSHETASGGMCPRR